MPSRYAILRLVCALGGLTVAGCCSPYSPAPYSPYGSGIPMYPQAVPVQPQFGPPVISPAPVTPNGTFPPSNSFDGLSPTPDPGASGTFPPSNDYNGFNPTLPPNSGNSSGGLVPNYGDPDTLPPPNGGGTFGGGGQPFGSDGASFVEDHPTESIAGVRFERDATESRELQLTAHQPSASESQPIVLASNPIAPPIEPASQVAKKPNPYGYDAVGYRWLRGLVDFDEARKAWVLIYNPAPGPRDVYKGQITLIDNGELRRLKNNDVVLVEGQIDSNARDRDTGKPQYRIQKLYGPLVPKS